jgi:hypothetical protein
LEGVDVSISRVLACFGPFVLSSLLGAQAPPTTAELVADETGDNPANYISGSYGPSSLNSCKVVLRVVQARTMAPVDNVQVAIDTRYNRDDPDPPEYNVKVRADGMESFVGGHVRYMTKKVHSGVVSLGSMPPSFMMSVNVVQPGHASNMGLVYRQCFAPTTVLLYVIKDDGDPDEQSGDFLWVKPGHHANPPPNRQVADDKVP